MDSLTQLALGAAVGAAVLGRRLGPRRAALVGGVLGTLPDLDVLYPFDDPVDTFVLHRAATHSLLVQAAVTPLFGEALLRLFRDLRGGRAATHAAVYLVFATHALLDAMTVYGTRLLWPVWPEAVGVGSVFIIDPLYTLPLLAALVWALWLRAWTPRFRTGLAVCLGLSTGYLGWSLLAQQTVAGRAGAALAEAGIRPQHLLALPTPFNTLHWRVIAIDGTAYYNLYLSALGGGAPEVYRHPRGVDGLGCLAEIPAAAALADFTDGFFRVDLEDGLVVVSDLRMGLTPNYVFRFAVARPALDGLRPLPPRRAPVVRSAEGDLPWLLARLAGRAAAAPRPAEATAAVAAPAPAPAGAASPC